MAAAASGRSSGHFEDRNCTCCQTLPHMAPKDKDPWLDPGKTWTDRLRWLRRRYVVCVTSSPVLICTILSIIMVITAPIPFMVELGEPGAGASPGQIFALEEVAVRRQMALNALLREDRASADRSDPRSEAAWDLLVILTAKGDDLWTHDGMLDIFDISRSLRSEAKYKGEEVEDYEDYCWLAYSENSTSCRASVTPVDYILFPEVVFGMDENTTEVTREMVDELTTSEIKELALEKLLWAKDPDSAPAHMAGLTSSFLTFFDKEITDNYHANMSASAIKGKFTQLVVFFGGPLKGYKNSQDDRVEQDEKFRDWIWPQYNNLLLHIREETKEFEGVNWWENTMGGLEIQAIINGDLLLTAIAGSLIFIVLALQTGIPSLSIIGVLFVAWTYPSSLIVYFIFRRVSPQMNQLALFTLLGVGADNLLVALTAMEQSFAEPDEVVGGPDEPYKRMDFVLWRTFSATSIANFTTTVAFALTSFSPIPLISSFGILASVMTVFLFVGTQTFFFTAIYIWYYLWKAHLTCCFMHKTDPRQYLADGCGGRWGEKTPTESSSATSSGATAPASTAKPIKRVPSELQSELDMSEYRAVERFFYTVWAPTLHRARYFLLLVFVVLFSVGIWGTLNLRPPDDEEVGLPSSSNIYIIVEHKLPKFSPASLAWGGTRVAMVWGVDANDPLDRTGLDPNDEFNTGTVLYTPKKDFPIHTLKFLRFLAGTCDTATEYQIENKAEDKKKDPATRIVDVDAGGMPVACTPRHFLEWEATQQGLNSTDDLQTGVSWNYTTKSFATRIKEYVTIHRSSIDPTIRRMATSWMGVASSNPDSVKAILIYSNATLPFDPDAATRRRHVDAWNDMMEDVNEDAEDKGWGEGYATQWFFAGVATNDILVRATYQSLGITYAVAVACVALVSGNWMLSLIAAGQLATTILLVLAILVWMGKTLGWVESILVTILPGLAVDAPVHISQAYSLSHANGRFRRTSFALLEIGVAVLGGGLTSIIPNIVLQGAAMPFFTIYGTILALAIGTAVTLAFTTLPALLMIFGPKSFVDGSIYALICHKPTEEDDKKGKGASGSGGHGGRKEQEEVA